MVAETPSMGPMVHAEPLGRIVLYKRGAGESP